MSKRGGTFVTTVPKIQKWDRIYVEAVDAAGEMHKDVFHVTDIKKIQKRGDRLVLHCSHQSSNLWSRTISFARRRLSQHGALEVAIGQLNGSQKGTNDPTVEIPTNDTVAKVGNFFDPETANDQIYEDVRFEEFVTDLKRKELQPPEDGGSHEPMLVRFVSKYDHSTGNDLDTVLLQAIPQGFKDNGAGAFTSTPTDTLKQTELSSVTRPDVFGLDGSEKPEKATNLRVVANKNSGSFPKEFSMFQGAKFVFQSAPAWESGKTYKKGILVIDAGVTYEAKSDHDSAGGNQPASSVWIARTFTKPNDWATSTSYSEHDLVVHNKIAYEAQQAHTSSASDAPGLDLAFWVRVSFVPSVDYSPLTKVAQYWINALAGAKYAATDNSKAAWVDPTVVIKDEYHPREPVDYVNTNPTLIPSELKVDGNIPDGFRMLVIDPATGSETGAGDFSGSDEAGLSYAGNIAEFWDEDHDGIGVWKVLRSEQSIDDHEVFEWYESLSWTKNPCEPASFTLGIPDRYVDNAGACKFTVGGASAGRQTVWKKGAYAASEVIGIGTVGAWIADRQFECMHSVKWDSSNSRIDMSTKTIMNQEGSTNSAIFVKSAPLDATRIFAFGVGLNIHARWPRTGNTIPFTSVSAGEAVKHPIMDLNNMHRDQNDNEEFFGPGVEDLYPLQGFAFNQEFIKTLAILDFLDFNADFSFGIWLMDRRSEIVVIDYNHARDGKIIPVEKSLSSAATFQGVHGNSAFLAPKQPDGISTFDPRSFLMGGIYTKDTFDSEGRYAGLRSRYRSSSELELAIDAYRMVKPIVVTNVDEPNAKPTRNIEAQTIKKQNIISYSQAKNLVLGLEKIFNHEDKKYTVDSRPKHHLKLGDPVYYENTTMLDDADDALANTVKAVVNKITITISKPKGTGKGGMTQVTEVATRFWP